MSVRYMIIAAALVGCVGDQFVRDSSADSIPANYGLDTDVFVHVDLNEETRISDVQGMLDRYSINQEEVREIRFVSGEISGGYTPDPSSPIPVTIQFSEKVTRHFQDLADRSSEIEDESVQSLNEQQRLAAVLAQRGDLQIVSLELSILPNGIASDSFVVNTERFEMPTIGVIETSFDPHRSYWHEDWAPYYVFSDADDSFAYQYFAFDDIASFGSHLTYEAEWQIWQEGLTYGGSWSTTMPDSYRDTMFMDGGAGVVSPAIGTGSPEQMNNFTTYYVATDLYIDPAERDPVIWVSIKGQKSNFVLSWCEGLNWTYAWCVGQNREWTSLIDSYYIEDFGPFYATY